MATKPETDDRDSGHVIVSFSLLLRTPIDTLSPYLDQGPDGELFYDLGTETFTEQDAHVRADKLDVIIIGFLDLVELAPRDVLHDPDAFIRLFMTIGAGAYTLRAGLLKRLAAVNATIWIDA